MSVVCSISGVTISPTAIGAISTPHPIYLASLETFGKALDRWETLSEDDQKLVFSGILNKNPLIKLQSTKAVPVEFMAAFVHQMFDFTMWINRRDPSLVKTFPTFLFNDVNCRAFPNIFATWYQAKKEWEEATAKAKARYDSRMTILAGELEFDEELEKANTLSAKFGVFLQSEDWINSRVFSGRYATILLSMLAALDSNYADRDSGAFKSAHKVLTTEWASLERSKGWNLDTVNSLLNVLEWEDSSSPESEEFEFDPDLLEAIPHNMRRAATDILYAIRVRLTGSESNRNIDLLFDDEDESDEDPTALTFDDAPAQKNVRGMEVNASAPKALNAMFVDSLIAKMTRNFNR